jgi:hypothetical protein
MNEEEHEIIQSLWHHTELARPSYSDVRPIVSTLSPRMRVYTLPNSEMQVVANPLDDGGARIQLHLASGAFHKSWSLQSHDPLQRRVLPLFWRVEKYMLVIHTLTGLTDVCTALAQDASRECESMSVDIILHPIHPLNTPKFRVIVDIAADPSLLGTVTFFERFWITPTDRPVVRRRNAKHFASAEMLARFVQMKRR